MGNSIKPLDRYGRLTVLKRTVFTKRAKWLVRCDCGVEKEVLAESLRSGSTKSCGCLRSESVKSKNMTHGLSNTEMYRRWQMILDRCNNPNSKAYKNYGGRGISVCKSWSESFESFIRDVGYPPGKGYSLDRINNDGDYSPGNVRWATQLEQSRNTRRNILITYKGEIKVLKDWAVTLGISHYTLVDRLHVQDLSVDEAFTKPVGRWN